MELSNLEIKEIEQARKNIANGDYYTEEEARDILFGYN